MKRKGTRKGLAVRAGRVPSVRWLAWLLAMVASASPAHADCLNWAHYLGNPRHGLIYAGTVGDHPVRMLLHLDGDTSHFTGAYGYSDQPGTLALTGSLRPGGAGIDLVEDDQKGRETGRFELEIFRASRFGETSNPLPGCDNLAGEWLPMRGGKASPVSLHLDSELDPAYDQWQRLNDETAYILRRAMLEKDAVTFASLLRYPFFSERGLGVVSVWKSPQDVVMHYKDIVLFPKEAIRNAVPHFLASGADQSTFMNRSVTIYQGKVIRVCEAACPVIPPLANY